jgi:hypothetical protein
MHSRAKLVDTDTDKNKKMNTVQFLAFCGTVS